ncbi:histone-lysine N-methyltransferase trr, partial [Formica exsecta]|uniref:histone-lysine N-methyltransferase trr n=1 Tax=Formica exsecta TaxID=72781 RepID=UPI0011449312
VQNQIQVAQKPIVSQQVSSSTSSVHQQSVQQVPHSHGTIAGLPQGVTGPTAPSSSNIVPLVEVKKELGLEEVLTATGTTPTSHLQTDTKDFLTAKEELIDSAIDDKTDLKKLKRRQYQQKRKQSQGKDAVTAPQKKRSRKVSRLDEDYETFVENLMTQLRQLQPMVVLEPLLGRNYGVCPIFGCGDLVKIGSQKDYNTRIGDLIGNYGSASLPGISDHYNTQPFGELNPLSPQQPSTTQRGFYEQEFPPLKLDDTDDKKETMATNRDVDSPDTIVSSSSPECVIPEFMHHFPGLRLIEEESDDEADWLKRVSPVIPLISPIPIRLKPAYSKDAAKQDKENFGIPKLGKSPPIPLRENGNVTVTLTLNSQAADDIMGVLKDLANILNIAPPAGYQIVERTSTPPSQKLGLYRTKGKDGKEGAPVDIQSILNGATKFCRHCDIVVFNNLLIRKKVSDLPFFSKEEAEPGDELCFCSTACYMQFALIRTPSNTQDKTMYCPQHILKNEKDKELITLSAYRRVYVNRDENRQVAAVMHHSEHNHLLRVGSLIFLSVGQLLPHQLQNFHTPNYIYPVGYKIVRFYWSMRRANKRCRYVCSIHDVSGRPEFRVLIQEPHQEDVELRDATPRAVWSRILEPLAELRRSTNSVQLFPRYVSGEDLFGLTEPTVVRVLESLPGIETLTDYRFKYGRNPLLELPLAINPTGSARTEARLRNQLPWKRPHTQRTGGFASRGVPFGLSTCSVAAAMGGGVSSTLVAAAAAVGETASCPYSKQFVHSKSSQYKKMKQEWRNNVYLARSKIQGLGLYAARDLEKHTMVIEYIGEIIRTELAETREKQYEARNRGIYMFRLDEERVVDATLCGGLARYINHSCNPNCVAEIVEVERDLRIIIFAKRRISRGEELAYDYKFDIEDDQHKIACACGAPNCRKWMN